MNPKDYLTNKSFCPLPWTGFYLEPTGKVKNCVVAKDEIGNINSDDINKIMAGESNGCIKQAMRSDDKPSSCSVCHNLEEGKKKFDIISSRLYYLKELKNVPMDLYDKDDFDLRHVDIRWQNTCNHACIYCGPEWSSKWERELGTDIKRPSKEKLEKIKSYVLDNAHKLENVYLAGGEPLLMTYNEELLDKLLQVNPSVSLRVNTNLSKTRTKVFDKLLSFPNVHWIISIDTMGDMFEYTRWGGKWEDFMHNLLQVKGTNHKISFNMLWFALNGEELFDTIDHLMEMGFQANSFVLGPVTGPRHLDIRNLPGSALQSLRQKLNDRIALKEGYLLQDGYDVLKKHIDTPFTSNVKATLNYLDWIDKKRGLNSRKIFSSFYSMAGMR